MNLVLKNIFLCIVSFLIGSTASCMSSANTFSFDYEKIENVYTDFKKIFDQYQGIIVDENNQYPINEATEGIKNCFNQFIKQLNEDFFSKYEGQKSYFFALLDFSENAKKIFKSGDRFTAWLAEKNLYNLDWFMRSDKSCPERFGNYNFLQPQVSTLKFPIVLFLQGSESRYQTTPQHTIAQYFHDHGYGILAINKVGINPLNCTDSLEEHINSTRSSNQLSNFFHGTSLYHNYNSFEQCINDVIDCLKRIEYLYPLWSGEVVIYGHSEGGFIAPLVAQSFASYSQNWTVTGIIQSGGCSSLSEDDCIENLKSHIESSCLNNFIINWDEIRKILSISRKMQKELTLSKFGLTLDHEFWILRQFMNYKPEKAALGLSCPILIVHGQQDKTMPYQGALDLRKMFRDKNKSNLTLLAHKYGHFLPSNLNKDNCALDAATVRSVKKWLTQQKIIRTCISSLSAYASTEYCINAPCTLL